jgi:hypothetical protein
MVVTALPVANSGTAATGYALRHHAMKLRPVCARNSRVNARRSMASLPHQSSIASYGVGAARNRPPTTISWLSLPAARRRGSSQSPGAFRFGRSAWQRGGQ